MRTTRNTSGERLLRPGLSAMAIMLGLSCTAFGQTTRYVDDDTCPNSGAGSLVDPYCGIQVAIAASIDGDTVEVSPGTYFESINFNGKAIELRSSDGAATTIIDASNVPDLGDGVSVVRCVSGETVATVLDGFTITGGTGDTSVTVNPTGGGMYNDGSSPTVINCMFSGNRASSGGGMYNRQASPTVMNCIFDNNISNSGGGISNHRSNPTFTNCSFNENTAESGGGGMLSLSSNITLINCLFSRNKADGFGGGMLNSRDSSTITACVFTGNISSYGGGIYNRSGSGVTFTNCLLSGNLAYIQGGGMFNRSGDPTLINCTFSGNTADDIGGGMYNQFSSPKLTNCILWSNSPDEMSNQVDFVFPSLPTFAYCDIGGSGGSAAWNSMLGLDGGHNIDVDPQFVNPLGPDGVAGSDDDDLRLLTGSPVINIGNDLAVPAGVTTDLDGLPRFVCQRVDLGAYENHSPPLRVHNTTLDVFYCTIQECIDAAADSDECVAEPGTYYESIDFLGKAITVRSLDGPATTTIDASRVLNFGDGVSVVRCVSGETEATVLDGFTITGGVGDAVAFVDSVGGGMINDGSSPTVANCIFRGNTSAFGGGMFNSFASPTVTNCAFSGNTAEFGGGGMYNFNSSSPMMTNCTFSGNSTTSEDGGGMSNNFGSSPTMTNCILWGNSPNDMVNISGSMPAVSYCDIGHSGGSLAWNPWMGLDGGGNIDVDPLFVSPLGADGIAGSADDDLRLMSDSPANNAGNNAAIPAGVTTDLGGLSRIVCRVDMGAHENQSPSLPVHNTTRGTSYCTIQACIDAAEDFQECLATPGRYFETIDFLGKAIAVRGQDGPALTVIDAADEVDVGKGYSVVSCVNGETAATVLEGFTITGGIGTRPFFDWPSRGGGMHNDGSSPTVNNCIFSGNAARFGGGMFNSDSSPAITNCVFRDNYADGAGGGMYNGVSDPLLINCMFNGNNAVGGGGVYNGGSSTSTLTNCSFIGNEVEREGGGVLNYGDGLTLNNCMFSRNMADENGGGINNRGTMTLSNCTFLENRAGDSGGGIGNRNSASLINCSLSGNIARNGGGMINWGGKSTLTNCQFSGNHAIDSGGGISNSDGNPILANCSFNRNVANRGGGMYSKLSSIATITNCIMWGDSPDEIISDNSTMLIAYSDIEGSGGSANWDVILGDDGGGNIDADPLFVDPLGPDGVAGTEDDDLRLMADSPCIDAADYDAYLESDGGPVDLDGKDRVIDNIDNIDVVDTGVGVLTYLDMGAYENGECHDDGIIDLGDAANLVECLFGPADVANFGCVCVDFDANEHVDLRDFAMLQLSFNP